MTKVILKPLYGAELKGRGELRLGEDKNSALRRLGFSETYDKEIWLLNFSLHVMADAEDKIEFIECVCNPVATQVDTYIYGLPVRRTKVRDLFAVLATENGSGDPEALAKEYDGIFNEISVGFYREILPENVESEIAEAKAAGNYEEMRETYDEDMRRMDYLEAIGIGGKEYYQNCK